MTDELDYAGTAGLDVLDVGCGQGIDLVRYARAGAHVTGVDLTPRHCELARAHLAALGLQGGVEHGDAEALPFEDASFDRVSSNGVLHHTPDLAAALREIRRVLRPGGEARVILYNRRSLHYWINQVAYHGVLRGLLIRERSMTGVMARTVEAGSALGARPLVRVYSGREVTQALGHSGFREARARTRHFRATDTVVTKVLERHISKLRDPAFLDHVGRRVGWYVVGFGRA